MALAMLLGGLRASEVRSLRLADLGRGMRRVRVVGKGNKERTVPIDRAFFTECGNRAARGMRHAGVFLWCCAAPPGTTVD